MTDEIIGTLTDEQINDFCDKKELISENFCKDNIEQACYELRASNIYYDLADGNKKHQLDDGDYILIKPKQLVVIITKEKLNFPQNILGRILTKGKLFSIGLLPVNTYADPGFCGKLGIVFNNFSNDFIKIKPDDSIAKIEFSKLNQPVNDSYTGQHGYQTEIWPIPEDMLLTEEEKKGDSRIKDFDEEIELSYGKDMAKIIRRVFKYEKYLIFSGITYLVFSLILISILTFTGKPIVSPIFTISLGVISNIIFALVLHISTNIRS